MVADPHVAGMKIVFSRKGFDSATGGGPSPIVDGRPLSLPIPTLGHSVTSYAALGLGDHAARASRGRQTGASLCHHDPMFTADGRGLLGQCGAAQSHLERQGVGPGDLFVFFGLFAAPGEAVHHRIFGWLMVARVTPVAGADPARLAALRALGHPHGIAPHGSNDAVWEGPGAAATRADPGLRLTGPDGPASVWHVPPFLKSCGLTYHGRADRWDDPRFGTGTLRTVGRGQEFVTDVGDRPDARAWAAALRAAMPVPCR